MRSFSFLFSKAHYQTQMPVIPSAVLKSPQPFVPGVLSSVPLPYCMVSNKVFLASFTLHVLLWHHLPVISWSRHLAHGVHPYCIFKPSNLSFYLATILQINVSDFPPSLLTWCSQQEVTWLPTSFWGFRLLFPRIYEDVSLWKRAPSQWPNHQRCSHPTSIFIAPSNDKIREILKDILS